MTHFLRPTDAGGCGGSSGNGTRTATIVALSRVAVPSWRTRSINSSAAHCIVVASRTEPRQFCACLVLSSDRLDVNGRVRRLMGARKVSFASPEDTRELTGMIGGGVTPFGLPEHVPCYVDERIMALDWVIVGVGSRSQKVKVAPAVLAALPNAEVIDGLSLA